MSFALAGPDAAFQRQALARLIVAFTVGAALNLAFAPTAWWPIGVLTPAALFVLIRGLPPRRAAWTGAAFGAGLFGFGTYWIYIGLHVFGLVPVWLTIILQLVLVGVTASFCAAMCFIANRFWLKPSATRDWLVLPACWVLLEWLRGWILSGFPWLSLGYAFIDSPLAAWAPCFGVYGVTYAAALAAVALSIVVVPGAAAPGAIRQQRVIAVVVILVLLCGPLLLARHAWTRVSGASLPVAAVQGAVPQNQKWQADNQQPTMARYLKLNERAWGARLIVWPESALPVIANEIPEYLQDLAKAGQQHHADFAIGLVNYQVATAQYFNGLYAIAQSGGGGWYYKRHLVPFGEYFPVPSFVRSWLRLMSLPSEDFTAGARSQPVLDAAGEKLGITICYEDAFGAEQLRILRDATLLINVTNNAWFGDSTAPHQHFQISRMRALEAGRYLVRATNDGITAVIGPRGEVVAQLPQFQQAVLRADVLPMTGLTPYARWGNYPVVLGAFAALATALWRRRAT